MRKTLATIALAAIALTGCDLATPPGIPDVEIGDAATVEADTDHRITDTNGDWRVVSRTNRYDTPEGEVMVSATTLNR